MRRVLVAAAVAIPLAVLAAISATQPGQLLEISNYNSAQTTSYINAAQCFGTETSNPLNVEWQIALGTGVSFIGTGTYTLYASDTQPAAVTGNPANLVFCAKSDVTTGTTVHAGSVGSVTADLQVKDLPVSGNLAVTKAGKGCGFDQENQVVWICAHWNNGSGENGSATGKFTIQVKAPAPVDGNSVSVGSGDSRLIVDFTASTGGDVTADHYIAEAVGINGEGTFRSDPTNSTTATINGLTNGTTYSVTVKAYSVGGNASAPSMPAQEGTPRASADFWDVYKDRGGVEKGGCASGSAGGLALLGTASLLALCRRKS